MRKAHHKTAVQLPVRRDRRGRQARRGGHDRLPRQPRRAQHRRHGGRDALLDRRRLAELHRLTTSLEGPHGLQRFASIPPSGSPAREQPELVLPRARDARARCRSTAIATEPASPDRPSRVAQFKDAQGRIRRQAARFRVFVYDDEHPAGRELTIGDSIDIEVTRSAGQQMTVSVQDVQWTVYLANKKASWYEFQETRRRARLRPDHPLRNAAITNTEERQKLIIDPGPRTVSWQRQAQPRRFAAADSPAAHVSAAADAELDRDARRADVRRRRHDRAVRRTGCSCSAASATRAR